MIYTCTLNPSLDYFIELDHLKLGEVNHITNNKKMPGGKGINVSRVLKRLGVESTALGFIGGFSGRYIQEAMIAEDIHSDFLEVEGDTRINVKAKANVETQFNGQSPEIKQKDIQALFDKLSLLKDGDILVLSGSVPSMVPPTIYKDMMTAVSDHKVKIVVDTTNEALSSTFQLRPFLIKPNHKELGDLFNVTINSVDQAIPYAKKLIDEGVEQVIVSMAEKGALYVNQSDTVIATVPKGSLKNSVGAGDSLVGGFLTNYMVTSNAIKAFRYGVASGSATAFSIDLCTAKGVSDLLSQVNITYLS